MLEETLFRTCVCLRPQDYSPLGQTPPCTCGIGVREHGRTFSSPWSAIRAALKVAFSVARMKVSVWSCLMRCALGFSIVVTSGVDILAAFPFPQRSAEAEPQVESEPSGLQRALDSYVDSARSIRNEVGDDQARLRAWREQWLKQLLSSASANELHPQYDQALIYCVGLANSLGRVDLAGQLSEELAITTEDPNTKSLMLNEVADLKAHEARSSTKPEDIRAAIDAYTKANAALDQSIPKQLAKYVRNLAIAGELYAESGALDDAKDAYDNAVTALSGPQELDRALLSGYDIEHLLFNKMRLVAATGEFDALRADLSQLERAADRRSPAQYVVVASQLSMQNHPRQTRELLNEFLARRPGDAQAPQLMHEIAKTFVVEQRYEDAARQLESILTTYEKQMLDDERDVVVEGNGGLLSVVYFDLIVTYKRLGEHERASMLSARAAELFPNDPAIRGSVTHAASEADAKLTEDPSGATSRVLLIVMANVIVVVMLVVWIVLKRTRNTLG